MTAIDHDRLAQLILDARGAGRTIAPLTDDLALTLADAYAVQAQLTALRRACGERLVGWKLGYTSAAMRRQMGVHEPNLAPITDAMLLADGAAVARSLLQPRVEPEFAAVLRSGLSGRVTRAEALSAVEAFLACLEVVDSVFDDYRFRLEDNTADGSSAAHVVLGARVPSDRLDTTAVLLERNGQLVATAAGAAASGHPVDGLVWLAEQRQLEPGHVVILGGMTAAEPLDPGDTVTATFGGRVLVTVRREVE